MTEFAEWFTDRMAEINYTLKGFPQVSNELTWYEFNDANERFDVLFLHQELKPEDIRGLFESEDEPVLFIVDHTLISKFIWENEKPLWIRILHALYYGRIYVWFGHENFPRLNALHFEWGTGRHKYSEPIDITGILFTRTDCQLRDFPGTFYIARFYDRAFWKEQSKPPPKKETWKERAKKQREEWEQATKGHAEEKPEDVFEAFKRAFKEEYERSQYRNQRANQNYSHQAPTGDKWLSVLIATGSLEAARTKYKQLAKQYHPDLNPGDSEALETMKAINIAYERVEEYWR